MIDVDRYLFIKSVVDELIDKQKTTNPSIIASNLNIYIKETNVDPEIFKARVFFIGDNRGIMINSNLCDKSKKILISHEIGHTLLHKEFLTYYGYSCSDNVECEANIFALELLSKSMSIDFSQIHCEEFHDIVNDILKIKECCS